MSASKIPFLVIINEIRTILYFPIWWYSKGLVKMLKTTSSFIADMENTIGFWIWVKNLFVPMFGQHDIAGRIISFFLRFFQVAVKGLVMLVIMLASLIVVIIWLILPPFAIYQCLIHIKF
ncbi:MAG: hypothetical protein NTZ49_04880 [Candidatus Parcubacteria bacterium]|nr:hypothetical protein [Candidatus Parcubacteria bacterium]